MTFPCDKFWRTIPFTCRLLYTQPQFLDLHSDLSDDEDFSVDVEQAISNPIEFDLDFYSREDLDAFRDNGYLNTTSSLPSQSIPDDVCSFNLSLEDLQTRRKLLSNAAAAAQSRQQIGTIGD